MDQIYAHEHINGSGPRAFGGAKTWPVVNLEVAFAEGDIEGRDKLVEALRAFMENYYKDEEQTSTQEETPKQETVA